MNFSQTTCFADDHSVALSSPTSLCRLWTFYQVSGYSMSKSAIVQLKLISDKRVARIVFQVPSSRTLLHRGTAAQGWHDWPDFSLSSGGCMANSWTSVPLMVNNAENADIRTCKRLYHEMPAGLQPLGDRHSAHTGRAAYGCSIRTGFAGPKAKRSVIVLL